MERVTKKDKALTFWISNSGRRLSFRPHPGYEAVVKKNQTEMWELIHQYIEEGYHVL